MEIRDFPGRGDPAYLLPRQTPQVAPFFQALREGRLQFQRCEGCGRARYPIAPVCPHCQGRSFRWSEVAGSGRVHSWIRYHRSYLPEFEPLMPYVVLCVQLDEGPRVFGRLASADVEPTIDMPVAMIVERWPSGDCVFAFVAAPDVAANQVRPAAAGAKGTTR